MMKIKTSQFKQIIQKKTIKIKRTIIKTEKSPKNKYIRRAYIQTEIAKQPIKEIDNITKKRNKSRNHKKITKKETKN